MKYIIIAICLFLGLIWWLVGNTSPTTAKHYENWLNRATTAYFAVGGTVPDKIVPADFILALSGRNNIAGYSIPEGYSYPTPSLNIEQSIYVVNYDKEKKEFHVRSKTDAELGKKQPGH